MDLTKSQKKIARMLINKGLQIECAEFMAQTKDFINTTSTENPHEAYLKLFERVYDFDKIIAKRYDGLRGSTYYVTVLGLYMDNVLTDEDIQLFDEETQERIKNHKKFWSEN